MPMTQAQYQKAQAAISRGNLFTLNGRTAFNQEGLAIIVAAEGGMEGDTKIWIAGSDTPSFPEILDPEALGALTYAELGNLCAAWGLLVPARKADRLALIAEAQEQRIASRESALESGVVVGEFGPEIINASSETDGEEAAEDGNAPSNPDEASEEG